MSNAIPTKWIEIQWKSEDWSYMYMFKNSIFWADLSDSQNHIISDDGYNNKITIHVVTSSNLTWWLLFSKLYISGLCST